MIRADPTRRADGRRQHATHNSPQAAERGKQTCDGRTEYGELAPGIADSRRNLHRDEEISRRRTGYGLAQDRMMRDEDEALANIAVADL